LDITNENWSEKIKEIENIKKEKKRKKHIKEKIKNSAQTPR
jgi:hypothetical protein